MNGKSLIIEKTGRSAYILYKRKDADAPETAIINDFEIRENKLFINIVFSLNSGRSAYILYKRKDADAPELTETTILKENNIRFYSNIHLIVKFVCSVRHHWGIRQLSYNSEVVDTPNYAHGAHKF